MAADKELEAGGIYAVYDDECSSHVIEALEDLVLRCEQIMRPTPAVDVRFRTNIFIAQRQALCLSFSVRMEDAIDRALMFPDAATGVTGWVYQTHSPAICNLKTVGTVVDDTSNAPFNMGPKEQREIDPKTSWLLSYPIFDPRERQALDVQAVQTDMPTAGLHRLRADHVGPILGILNVDAAWDYESLKLNPSPEIHSADPRVLLLVDTVAQASLRIARLLISKNERSTDGRS